MKKKKEQRVHFLSISWPIEQKPRKRKKSQFKLHLGHFLENQLEPKRKKKSKHRFERENSRYWQTKHKPRKRKKDNPCQT